MKEPLKTGDRVRCYGYGESGLRLDGEKATFISFEYLSSLEYAKVNLDNNVRDVLHIRQLKRLKVKKRKEIWLTEVNKNLSKNYFHSLEEAEEDFKELVSLGAAKQWEDGVVRFVEARKKKR